MNTTTTNAFKPAALPGRGILAGLILLTIAGFAAWIVQLSQGMQTTGLGQHVVWGLYIAMFFSAAGAGAGLLGLAALAEFRTESRLNRVCLLVLALASFVVAGLVLLFDLGNPLRVWRIAGAGRFSVMLTWDFWLLIAAGVVTLIYLRAATRPGAGARRGLGIRAIVIAIALVLVEGWLLASYSARPAWAGGMTVVNFLVQAGVASIALAALVKPMAPLPGWLITALGLDLVLVLAEVFTRFIGGDVRTAADTRNAVTGTLAPLFWIFLLIGLVLPLLLLVGQKGARTVRLAAILAAFGVLVEKLWFVVAGQVHAWLPAAAAGYLPSWVEFVTVLGLIALGALIYILVPRALRFEIQR